jgi:hypothetical protein
VFRRPNGRSLPARRSSFRWENDKKRDALSR